MVREEEYGGVSARVPPAAASRVALSVDPSGAMSRDESLRDHLIALLDGRNAHVELEESVDGIPADRRGVRPRDLPYSCWELLEHIRRAQWDILDFCRNADYRQPEWPADYWPDAPAPESDRAWTSSVDQVRQDLDEVKRLVRDPELDLFEEIPYGDGQTYLREVMLVADHNAYHLGQLVTVRRLLGIWD